jgi:hypothetical protein
MQPELRRVLELAVRYDDILDELKRAELAADAAGHRHDEKRERTLRGRASSSRRDADRARSELKRGQAELNSGLERVH